MPNEQPDYIQRPVDVGYQRGIEAMGQRGPQVSGLQWVNALAHALGYAVPFRGGIGEPWRVPDLVKDFFAGEAALQIDQRLANAATSAASRGDRGWSLLTQSPTVSRMPARGAGVFKDTIGHVPPEIEHDTLLDMLLYYLRTTSRQ